MKRRLIRWIITLTIVATAGFLIWKYTLPDPVEILVKPVEQGTVERTVANTRAGTVKACRRARLSPSIGGQISKLPVSEGQIVEAGKLLMELWNKDLTAEARLAKREAEAARKRAKAACLKAEEAGREADRLLKLHKTGAASEDETDRVVTEAKALSADCEAARASVRMSEARVKVVHANLERTRLIAPFKGVIAEINGELNEYITPSPVGVATLPAVDLIDNSCFYVTAPIDEVDASGIKPDMSARITLDAFGDRIFVGKVRRVAPYVMDLEKQARTVDVEIEFERPEDISELLAGYSADVEIILNVRNETLRIPTEAVMDGKRVFVYLPEKKIIEERELRKGISNWDYTEVLSGLKAGELVVVNVDRPGLKDGTQVVITGDKQ